MKFNLGTVLTVTTGRLFCPIGDLYEILNHMTGDNLFTHQLPRASEAAKPVLLAAYPRLASIDVPEDFGGSEDAVKAWLNEQQEIHGDSFYVPTMTEWESRNPLTELIEMREGKPVIAVVVD